MLARLTVAAYAVLLTLLSLAPLPPGAVEGSDKPLHALAYFVFMLLAARAVPRARGARAAAAAVLIGYGIALEFAQGMTGYRTPSLGDALANTVGVLVALGLTALWSALRERVV